MTKQHRQSLIREKSSAPKSKRPAESDTAGSSKRSKTGEDEVVRSSILPAGFFSNGAGPTIVADEDDDEGEEQGEAAGASTSTSLPHTTTTSATAAGQTGDLELDSFLASLAEPDREPTPETAPDTNPAPSTNTKTPSVIKKTTASYKDLIPGQASYEAAPVRNIPQEDGTAGQDSKEEEQESEGAKRARLAREEKEEMMDRLDEETRAQ